MTRVHEGWFQLRLNGRLLAGVCAVLAGWSLIILVAHHEGATRTTPRASTVSALPHNDITLGSRSAPMTLTVFADLTSPQFRSFERRVLPALAERYVQQGLMQVRLRVVMPTWAGPDARRVAHLAMAASLQGRLWDFVEAFESRSTTSLKPPEARSLLAQVRGLDTRAAFDAIHSPRVHAALMRARRLAPASEDGQPVFVLNGSRSIQILSAPGTARPFLSAVAGLWHQAFASAT